MLSDEGLPLLMDFGISHLQECSSTCETATDGDKGTIRYMAFELLQDDIEEDSTSKTHTTQSDVWAFGMIVYVNISVAYVNISTKISLRLVSLDEEFSIWRLYSSSSHSYALKVPV